MAMVGYRNREPRQLTATEHAIASLAARGRTNHEIAATLSLSTKTVEWNLTKIYRVLGVRGRTELAVAWARRREDEANGAAS